MSKINKVVVKGVSYDIEDAYARLKVDKNTTAIKDAEDKLTKGVEYLRDSTVVYGEKPEVVKGAVLSDGSYYSGTPYFARVNKFNGGTTILLNEGYYFREVLRRNANDSVAEFITFSDRPKYYRAEDANSIYELNIAKSNGGTFSTDELANVIAEVTLFGGYGGGVTREEFDSLQQSISDNSQGIATLNTTIINYNQRYSIAGAVTKKEVIEGLLNKYTADKGTIVTYYAKDGWHTIQYILNAYNPTQGVKEENWVEFPNIIKDALMVDTFDVQPDANEVEIDYNGVDGEAYALHIPSATTTSAGVMSAADKVNLNNSVRDISNLADTIENAEMDIVNISTRVDNLEKGGTGGGDGNITPEQLNSIIEQGKQLALRALFVAAGAEYNDTDQDIEKTAPWGDTYTHKAKHYSLNGLGDITEEQMAIIFNKGASLPVDNNLCRYKGRTNTYFQGIFSMTQISGYYWAYENNCEVLNFGEKGSNDTQLTRTIQVSYNDYFVGNAPNLRFIIGAKITFDSNKTIALTAFKATQLEIVYIYNLAKDISFYVCSKLNKTSVLYAIQNAKPTSAIAITLHHDAYVRLTEDQEVLNALNAKNEALTTEGKGGKISLVCATHNEEITPNA